MIQRLSLLLHCVFLLALAHDRVPDDFFARLLNGYNPQEHPRISINYPISTGFALQIYHLSVSNGPSPQVKFNGYIKLDYYDMRIAWAPEDRGGLTFADLPSDVHIWSPKIYYFKGGLAVDAKSNVTRARTNLRASTMLLATITQAYQIEDELSCQVVGSFPFETLRCSIYFINGYSLFYESFRHRHTYVYLKTMFMDDHPRPRLNGWKVVSSDQRRMLFDPENGTLTDWIVAPDEMEQTTHSAIYCTLVIRRDDWSQVLITYIPLTMMALIIAGAWLTAPSISIGLCFSAVYLMILFIDDIVQRAPDYVVDYSSAFAISVLIWATAAVTGVIHLLMVFFPRVPIVLGHYLCRFFKYSSLFVRLETRLLNGKHDSADLPLEVHCLRTLVSFSLILAFFCILLLVPA